MRNRSAALVALLLLAACKAPVVPTGTRSPKPEPTLAPSTTPASASRAPEATPGPITSPAQPAAVTLSGLVKAPTRLISDNGLGLISDNGLGVVSNNGAGVVSNNGAGVVSNNGAGYKLLADTAQVPVAKATVTLLDAQGNPLKDPAGKPITTTTDAAGHYAFATALPAHGVLVAVQLPFGNGELAGVAPKNQASVDLDLISTLATGYVVRQYVRSQQDPQASLDKLTANLEADTRAKTAAAFASSQVAVPDGLTGERVVAAVSSLRRQDAALNTKLEEVKCLLVAAGQCDLGEGQLAKDLQLGTPWGLVFTPVGELLANSWLDGRIWRLDDDGRARAYLKGTTDLANLDPALWRLPRVVGFDPKGRAVIHDTGPNGASTGEDAARLSLLGPDGKPIPLWQGRYDPAAVLIGPDAFRILDLKGQWYTATPGKPAQPDGQLRAQDVPIALVAKAFGQDRGGKLWLCSGVDGVFATYRYDPATQGLVKELAADAAKGIKQVALDPAGNVFVQATGGKLTVQGTDGRVRELGTLPADLAINPRFGVVLGPDGAGYFATLNAVYRVADGQTTLAMGTGGKVSDHAGLLQFMPYTLASKPDGTLYAYDLELSQIYVLTPDGQAAVVAGGGAPGTDDGPAKQVALGAVRTMAVDPQGRLLMLDGALRRLELDGTIKTLYHLKAQAAPCGFALQADGSCLVASRDFSSSAYEFVKVDAAGQATSLFGPGLPPGVTAAAGGGLSVCGDGHGGLYVAGLGKLWRWGGGTTFDLLAEDDVLANVSAVTTDARGRLYFTHKKGAITIRRYDLATKAWTIVAGQGSAYFPATEGVDNALGLTDNAVAFSAAGDMLISDAFNHQIKRVPAAGL